MQQQEAEAERLLEELEAERRSRQTTLDGSKCLREQVDWLQQRLDEVVVALGSKGIIMWSEVPAAVRSLAAKAERTEEKLRRIGEAADEFCSRTETGRLGLRALEEFLREVNAIRSEHAPAQRSSEGGA